ncbi:unnamed protein product [Schistocephalus solidus]|uniref:LAM_G_DOMAIN domain-containing protein n=1 Tax=Schistocephalus solidus TaxID=70667 RepID=A0A183SYZ8_SCHSO|nr:unnamed protein product [Schistocephalus solidus]
MFVHFPYLRRSLMINWIKNPELQHVHLEFGAELETMSIPDEVLHASEGLAGFGDPLGNLIVNFGSV